MAKKIETIMVEGKAEVNHRGDDVVVSLPDWFTAAGDKFFDETALLAHCQKHDILLATLQAGFAQHLIDLRAKARPADLPPKEKGGTSIPQAITTSGAQERVDRWKPEPRKPAADPVAKAAKALEGLTAAQKAELLKALQG